VPDLNAALFDADGVIQRPRPDMLTHLVEVMGLTPEATDLFLGDIFAAETLALTGATDFENTLGPVLSKWGVSDASPHFRSAWHRIEADPSVLAVIAELRQAGVYCALASNQERHRAQHMSVELAYASAFDDEFYSCRLGHAKPSTAYFEEIIRRTHLDPARTLFIDDRAENVEAAELSGLHAAQFVLTQMGGGGGPLRELLKTFGLLAET
jgi:putative hydrolase of the HAD superfamily